MDEVDKLLALNKQSAPAPKASGNVASFVKEISPIAERIGERLGVDPAIVIGQMGLETGWGKSVIPGTNNYGNIKDFRGSGVVARDNMTGSVDKYRAFESADAFADHFSDLVERKYKNALNTGNDPLAYGAALRRGGYAEDPGYVNKIANATKMVRDAMGKPASKSIYPTRGDYIGDTEGVQARTALQAEADDSPVSTSLRRGFKGLAHNAGLFADNLADDAEGAAERIKEKREWDAANPAPTSSNEFTQKWQQLAEDDYMGMLGSVVTNPSGALNQMVEQTPNSLPALALQIPVGIASSALYATGWGAPIAMGLQGMAAFVGNVLPEGGGYIEDQLSKSGVNPNDTAAVANWIRQNRSQNLEGGIKKAGVISLVDGATGYLGGKLIAGPSIKFAKAEEAVLRNAGVDIADKAAVAAARATPAYKQAMAAPAQELLAATTRANKTVRELGGFGLEAAGEGVGEYAGSYAANGEASVKDAVLEGLMGAGTSAGMTGANMALGAFKGPDMNRAGLEALAATPVQPTIQPNSPLSNMASIGQAAQANAALVSPEVEQAQQDPMAQRLGAMQSFVEDKAFLQALRGTQGYGPESVTELLSAYSKARNPNLDPLLRERALSDLENFVQTFNNRPNFVFGQNTQEQSAKPGTQVATVQQGAVGPAIRRPDGRTLEGEIITRPHGMGGANQNQLSAPPVLGLPTEEALQAKRQADADYDQAYQDLVKAEQLGASDAELAEYQRTLLEAARIAKDLEAQIADADTRAEDARRRDAEARRREILASVIAQGIPGVNPVAGVTNSFKSELMRQGYRDVEPTEAETQSIFRAVDVANAREDGPLPSLPNEVDFYEPMKPPRVVAARPEPKPKQQPARKLTPLEIRNYIAAGAVLNGDILTLPDGVVIRLKGPQIAAAREAFRKQGGVIEAAPQSEVESKNAASEAGEVEPENKKVGQEASTQAFGWPRHPDSEAMDLAREIMGKRFEATHKEINAFLAEGRARNIPYEKMYAGPNAMDARLLVDLVAEENLRNAPDGTIARRIASLEGKISDSISHTISSFDPTRLGGSGAAGRMRDRARAGESRSIMSGEAERLRDELDRRRADSQAEAKASSDVQAETDKVAREATESGRPGYESAVTVDATKLKRILEENRREPLLANPEKLEAWRNGTATTNTRTFPIALAFRDSDGKLDVSDGRHRIVLAAERGEPVTVFIDKNDVGRLRSLIDSASESPAFDVSARTDDQLRYLADNGKPGWKEAARAEMARREGAKPEIRSDLDAAAHEAATSPLNDTPQPTEGQKQAGNYKVGKVRVQGMDISIENPRGSVRSGTSPDGTKWSNTLHSHYGYFANTKAADGDHLDVYLTDGAEDAPMVWVIDQKNADGTFDEHKTLLGPRTEEEAKAAYLANYEPGWDGIGAISSMPIEAFKAWAFDGKKKRKPLVYVEPEVATEQPPERFAVGRSLNKDERKRVLSTLADVYRKKGHQKETRVDARGEEYSAYPYAPDLFEKSDITGKMVRYYVTLPDGRIAHPTELFPEYTEAQVEQALSEQDAEARKRADNDADRLRILESRKASTLNDANRIFNQQNRGRSDYVPATLTDGERFIRTHPDSVENDLRLLGSKWKSQPAPQEPADPREAYANQKAEAYIAKNGGNAPPKAVEAVRIGARKEFDRGQAEKGRPNPLDVPSDDVTASADRAVNALSESEAKAVAERLGKKPGRDPYATIKAEHPDDIARAIAGDTWSNGKWIPAQQPTHQDPGQPAEAATPAVIAESIQKSADNTPLNLKSARASLLADIDRAIAEVPAESAELYDEVRRYKGDAYEKETTRKFGAKEYRARRDSALAKLFEQIGFVTFDVPGDGKFKVVNAVEKLQEFRKKVEASPGFKEPAKKPPVPSRDVVQGGYTPRDAILEGEYLNAYELAKLQGKPLKFGRARGDHPNAFTDTSEVDGLIQGYRTFVGRIASDSKTPWMVIEESSGLSIGNNAAGNTSKAAAIADAKAQIKGNEKRAADMLGKGVADGKTQDQLEAEWLRWAEEKEGRALDDQSQIKSEEPANAGTTSESAPENQGSIKKSIYPDALALTPKQYHAAKLQWMSDDAGVSMAEVREMYENEAARANNEQEWVDAVRQAFKGGKELTRATLDKLEEVRPGALMSFLHDYPDAKVPKGYQTPAARQIEKAESDDRKQSEREAQSSIKQPSDLESIFAGLSSRGLAKSRAQKAAAAHPRSEQIAYVQENFHDILIQLMEAGKLEVNGSKSVTEENKQCL